MEEKAKSLGESRGICRFGETLVFPAVINAV